MQPSDPTPWITEARARIAAVPQERWHVVGPPWGIGDWVVAGNGDPHVSPFVATCDGDGLGIPESDQSGDADDRAALIALMADPRTAAALVDVVEVAAKAYGYLQYTRMPTEEDHRAIEAALHRLTEKDAP